MDFFALPDVFRRDVMKTMEIDERKTLRLVCRDFEKLVASTNAGRFERGWITKDSRRWHPEGKDPPSIKMVIYSGVSPNPPVDQWRHIDLTKEAVEQFVQTRNRLFDGISFDTFMFELDEDCFDAVDVGLLRKIVAGFKILKYLRLQVSTAGQLESALRLKSDYPDARCALQIWNEPGAVDLLSIPPVGSLRINSGPDDTISAEMLIALLGIHECAFTFRGRIAALTTIELKEVLEILSRDTRKRRVSFGVGRPNLLGCLRNCGITAASKEGDSSGGFDVILVSLPHIHLRYKHCMIELSPMGWSEEDEGNINVDISNCDMFDSCF